MQKTSNLIFSYHCPANPFCQLFLPFPWKISQGEPLICNDFQAFMNSPHFQILKSPLQYNLKLPMLIQFIASHLLTQHLLIGTNCLCPRSGLISLQWERKVKTMFSFFHASPTHPSLAAISSSFGTRTETRLKWGWRKGKKSHR